MMQTTRSNLDQKTAAASEKKGNLGFLRVISVREISCEESR
jgi:hypothetical protein